MNLYEESDYSIISLLIGICAVGTIFWWYISIPCAIMTILLAWFGRNNEDKKIFNMGGMLMGGLSIIMSVLVGVSLYTQSVNEALDEISPNSLKNKINLNMTK